MRTAEAIEMQDSDKTTKSPTKTMKRGTHPKSLANLIAPWQPGKSGNPGGRPKVDMAAEIARAVFTHNPELIYKAFAKALHKGSAYSYQVLSDRAFGKMKESMEISGLEGLADAVTRARARAAKK